MKDQESLETLQVFNVDGAKYKTRLSRKFNLRKPYVPADPRKIIAFIPGTINKVSVTEGETIKRGETLLTLEAMKMNNNVVSSIDGVIKKLYVKSGDIVSNKQLLVELE